jgi:uncharacterized protein YnzC (UPF0291/DUF896 family)
MPRGSRPGERRGGRQRGTPNKTTLLKNAVFCAAAAEPNRSPLDFMLALMRDPQVPLDLRIEMAAQAAPFVHARPEPTHKKRPDPLDLRDRLGETGDLKFGTLAEKPVVEASGDGGPSPLDFLLGVMADPAATPRQRAKAAAIAARYKHAYAARPDAPSMIIVEDKFGFKVDPELARAERDDRLRESRLGEFKPRSAEGIAAAPELKQIRQRRADRLALMKFPDGYTYSDRAADQKRLRALYSKRLSRKKLTPEEEAEEAHLAVRVLKPEGDESLKLPIVLWLSKLSMEIEWPTTRIAELDERVVGGETLTAAEEAERQDLRRRYPDSAAEADRIDHRYRYCFRKEMEIAEKAGMKYSKAYDAAKEKCEPLRDPTKIPRADLRSGIAPRIRELETLRWDNILTPEEADELEELHRRYPQRAEEIRKFVDRRLSYDQANREVMRRTGSDPGPIKEDGFPRNRTPTGRMAGR